MRRIGLLAFILLLATTPFTIAQDKLPAGAVARLGVHRLRVPGNIRDSAFTPDRRTFIIAHEPVKEHAHNTVLFDVATGLERGRLAIKQAQRIAVSWRTPMLAVATAQGFELWDTSTEKRVRAWENPKKDGRVTSIAIAPDGSQIAVAMRAKVEAEIFRWNAQTGAVLPTLEPKTERLDSVKFSADGSKLISVTMGSRVSDGKKESVTPGAIIAWDAKTGEKLHQRNHDESPIVVSPDGVALAIARGNQQIEIVDLDPKGIRSTTIAATGQPTFEFTPDGKQLALFEQGRSIRIWDIALNKEIRTLDGNVWAYSPQPRFSVDGTLIAAMQYDSHSYMTNQAVFWDLQAGKQFQFATGHPNTVNGLAFSPDGKLLATFSQDMILICDPLTGVEQHRWSAHKSSIEQIAFSPDGKLLASASVDGNIALWDPMTSKERKRLNLKESVKTLAFARDGKTLSAACGDQSLQTWDVETGLLLRAHMVHNKMASPNLSPTGQLLAFYAGDDVRYSREAALRLMNVRAGKSLAAIDLELLDVSDVEVRRHYEYTVSWESVFSPDAKLLITSDSVQTQSLRSALSSHTVRVWETATRREIASFNDNPIGTRLLAVSPNNQMLAHGIGGGMWGRGTDTSIILRDIREPRNESLGQYNKTGEPISKDPPLSRYRQIAGHLGSITCMTFSPDGRYLATGGTDQVAYVWRVEDFFKRLEPTAGIDDIDSLWTHLADAKAAKAYRAIAQLQTKPNEAIALLRKELRAVPRSDEKAIRQHLRDLTSNNFAARQQAYNALEQTGEQAAHLLEEQLKSPNSLEVRRRIEALLERLERPLDDANQLRIYRALTLLERIGSTDARKLLTDLSQGAPTAWLTIEAGHSLRRR